MTLLSFFSLADAVNDSREMDESVAATDAGLSAIDCTGVILGNADLAESCTWVPTEVVPGTTPLCGHEHAAPLAEDWRQS